ncbi:MAG: hypothetical protein OXG82_12590 [Gammaproteobacteria bacterium]|nr:hypothetical protein [Gammaproteobacteria bacterium]
MSDPRDEGLRRQLANLADRPVAGWKIGLTSGTARDSMGVGFRPFGYILADRVFPSGGVIPIAPFRTDEGIRVGVENELCFRMGVALTGDASPDEARAAVASVAPGFEINEQRLPRDAGVVDRLGDDLNQWGIVAGEDADLDFSTFDFASLSVALALNGVVVETVAADGHIDDHFASIAALARQLGRFGRTLEAGSRVITGSYTRQRVADACRWEGDFGPEIGRVSVEFR